MAKNGAQAPTEKPEAQKGSATKMPIFATKFDGSGSDNTDEFRRTLTGHIELQGIAASFYKALLKGELSCTAQCLVDHEPRKNDPDAFKAALELHGPNNFRLALELGKAPKRDAAEVTPFELMEFAKAFNSGSQYLANVIWANSTPAGRKIFEHNMQEDAPNVPQLWQDIISHEPEPSRATLLNMNTAIMSGKFFSGEKDSSGLTVFSKWEQQVRWRNNLKALHDLHKKFGKCVSKLKSADREEWAYTLSEKGVRAALVRSVCQEASTCIPALKTALKDNPIRNIDIYDSAFS